MQILADECCEASVVTALRAAGHDVRYLLETDKGANDHAALAIAAAEQRMLLTSDKDFGEIAFRRGVAVPAIVLLRLPPVRRMTVQREC